MNSYKYIARNLSGERKEGLRQAVCPNDVLGWLREQGFTPVTIEEIAERVKKRRQTFRGKRIKSADLAALCWQLTTMVEGGVPITTALETVAEDVENPRFQRILRQIVEDVSKGETLSYSIARFPDVFNPLSQALILAGETGGTLVESLRRLAQYFDNRDKLAKKVKSAMVYPVFVLGFTVLIVVFIMVFIIPQFQTIFDQIGGTLPVFTQMFMGFYEIVRHNLHYVLGVISVAMILAILAYTKTQKGHYWFSRLALEVPLIGKIISQAFVATFCRTMSTLIDAGVSVLEVFDILSDMTHNDIIRDAIIATKENIVKGSSISKGMLVAGFFPRLVSKMVQVGEESGSLGRALDRTADYYERKVDVTITTLTHMLEPIMILTIGAIVLTVVLALYLPIFSISDVTQ